ncbi:UNVERIFIED_CONTAM: hypothetical protein FKN15_000245 [Acipenser sinensis]
MAQVLVYLVKQQAFPPAPPLTPAPVPTPSSLAAADIVDRDKAMSEEDQYTISIAASWDGDSLEQKKWLSTVGSPSSRIDRADFSNEKKISKLDFKGFSTRF